MGFDLHILFLLASIRSSSGHEKYVSVDLRIYTRGVGVVRGALFKGPFIIKGKPIYISFVIHHGIVNLSSAYLFQA